MSLYWHYAAILRVMSGNCIHYSSINWGISLGIRPRAPWISGLEMRTSFQGKMLQNATNSFTLKFVRLLSMVWLLSREGTTMYYYI